MWGAQVAAGDPKWKLQVSWHSNTVMCETCDADQIRFAHFWLQIPPSATSTRRCRRSFLLK
jgi:hypothetical protein